MAAPDLAAQSADAPPAPKGRQVRAFGGYLKGFDGLRGFTIFCVLFYHARLGPYEGFYLSLSLFFVLSGFLITAILLDDRARVGRVDLRRFWVRRIRRLAPAALLGALAAVVYGATIATRSQAEQLPGDLVGVVFYIVNWTFITTEQSYTDIFAAPSPVQHYWSLAVEEQFYLIIPLSLGFLLKFKVPYRAVVGIFSGVIILSSLWMLYLYDGGTDIDRLYFGTDTRIAEVLVGVVLAIVLDHRRAQIPEPVKNVVVAAGIPTVIGLGWLWTTVGVTEAFAYRGGFLLNALLTGVLILVLVIDRGILARIFKFGPAVFIGRFSYGIYIYHFVIFLWLTEERTGLGPWPNCALRFAVTLVVAWASHEFIETPIRNGANLGLSRIGRLLAYPVAGAALIIGAQLTANTDGADPLATLRDDGSSLRAPVATADGVLDILVVHSENNAMLVDALEDAVADDDQIVVAARTELVCEGGVVEVDGSPTCANWAAEWPGLIDEHDPDSVLFFVDNWAGDPLGSLVVEGATTPREVSAALLGTGFDLLTREGASIGSIGSGQSYEVTLLRGIQPLGQSLTDLGSREDVNIVVDGVMPDPTIVGEDEYIEQSAEVLLDIAALYQRADRTDAQRVMVIGDSQARSLGYGLERWGAEQGVWVWNVATNGCGLADEGFTYGNGDEAAIRPECVAAVASLENQVASFDPDIVMVLSSAWDLGERRLEEWDEPLQIGAPDFDAYLTQEYVNVADVLTSNGASVIWMQAPCLDQGIANEPGIVNTEWIGPGELGVLNGEILPELATRYPEQISLYDLDAILCPDGEPLRSVGDISPIRGDGVHFNVEGSSWFAEVYGPELLELGGTRG